MKKILAATDLSDRSNKGLGRAAALADENQAQLHVIHVIDDELPQALAESSAEHAAEFLDKQINALRSKYSAPITSAVLHGSVHEEIINQSIEWGAELVVLGTTRHQLRSLFRGTVAERVIRFGRVPTLVVKRLSTDPYTKILVGADLSVHSRRALEFAAAFAKSTDIYCLHALHEPFVGFLGEKSREEAVKAERDAFLRELDADVAEIGQKLGIKKERFHTIMKTGDPLSVIAKCIEDLKADLVAIGTHGRTGIAHAVLGSVAEDCLAEAPIDVLVIRAW